MRWDYQPDICKDYKETGYCGFGGEQPRKSLTVRQKIFSGLAKMLMGVKKFVFQTAASFFTIVVTTRAVGSWTGSLRSRKDRERVGGHVTFTCGSCDLTCRHETV